MSNGGYLTISSRQRAIFAFSIRLKETGIHSKKLSGSFGVGFFYFGAECELRNLE